MTLIIPSHDNLSTLLYSENKHEKLTSRLKVLHSKTKVAIKKIFHGKTEQYSLQPGDTIYMVKDNDTLQQIANRFHISTQSLMSANGMTDHIIKTGSHLIIPTHPIQVSALSTTVLPGDTIYIVRKGDSIEKIARKFAISAAAIRLANLNDVDSFMEGEKIVVPTHLRG